SDPSNFKGDNRPVEQVSWDDVQRYLKKLGRAYRLPSEAEWEYAARAHATTAYSWGNAIGKNRANCDGCGSQWDDTTTAPVGSFSANDFGLYDMHGNVWEWNADCWHGSYAGAPSDGAVWLSGTCKGRVLRGGSWHINPRHLRSANRYGLITGGRINYIGFRVVLSASSVQD
ncbi:MAG: formylglycine-generating enzyme family protein, partial [Mariprofundaceae bacterium]|nr:formylglycine-generating enzyme family protein [Mariprofundaceae bacterium]